MVMAYFRQRFCRTARHSTGTNKLNVTKPPIRLQKRHDRANAHA